MDHDEFIRRAAAMSSLQYGSEERERVDNIGHAYLEDVHRMEPLSGDEPVELRR